MLVLAILTLGFVGFFLVNGSKSYSEVQSSLNNAVEQLSLISDGTERSLKEFFTSEPRRQPLSLPRHGSEFTYFKGRAIGLIQIHNRSDLYHSLIKIEDFTTGEPVAKYFVYSGQMIMKSLPEGRFRFKFASGTTWYGEPDLFGPRTTVTSATWAITVTQGVEYVAINPNYIEINIDAPLWSKERAQSKPLSTRDW